MSIWFGVKKTLTIQHPLIHPIKIMISYFVTSIPDLFNVNKKKKQLQFSTVNMLTFHSLLVADCLSYLCDFIVFVDFQLDVENFKHFLMSA